jgi:hypothetical protein
MIVSSIEMKIVHGCRPEGFFEALALSTWHGFPERGSKQAEKPATAGVGRHFSQVGLWRGRPS